MKKRLMISLFAGVLMAAMLPGVASADKPVTFTDSVSFQDVDPCTGELVNVTLVFDIAIHEHPNNFVVTVQRSGEIEEGYVFLGGQEHFVANENGEGGTFKDMWRNPETGAKFSVDGKFRIRGNAPIVEEFEMRCLGAPTTP
ncbi:MAG: hypothetical protein PVH07_11430 [Chloroflexota bacterium]|jgi:hypothetical protein